MGKSIETVKSLEEQNKAVRKTRTSSAVKNRYNQKHYIVFRASVKPELYQKIEEYKEKHGLNNPQFLTKAIESLEEK